MHPMQLGYFTFLSNLFYIESFLLYNLNRKEALALIYHSCVEMGVYVGVRLCLHSSHRLIYEAVRTFEIQVYAMPALDKSRGGKRSSLE